MRMTRQIIKPTSYRPALDSIHATRRSNGHIHRD